MGLQEHRPALKPQLFALAIFSWLCSGGLCLWLSLGHCLHMPWWQTLPAALGAAGGSELERSPRGG